MTFQNRSDAGRRLAVALREEAHDDAIVLALPRGGVVVAAEVARALGLPMDVLVARKLGAPGQPELGFGALAEDGSVVTDAALVRALHLTTDDIARICQQEAQEVTRRVARYRRGRALPTVRGRTVILVDDGIATGGTLRAALRTLQRAGAGRIVLAVPVGPAHTVASMRDEAARVVCLQAPEDLGSVGAWYDDFRQTTDQEVEACLAASS